jgi:hypoxanthine-DNA glycosylase
MNEWIQSFPPVISAGCRVLILGSMPGIRSLNAQQYYAHPQNQFWRIMGALFETALPEAYTARTAFLLKNGIGLWDVIHSCRRDGSLDTAIRQESAHDLETLFLQYPGIRFVGFNGAKAHDSFQKQIGFRFPELTFRRLPSTSPAYTRKMEEKLAEWQIIRAYV